MEHIDKVDPSLQPDAVSTLSLLPGVMPQKKERAHDDCVICLGAVTERAVAVPCNHCSFDYLCIATWLQENNSCPLCMTVLSAVEFDWRAPDDYKTYIVPRQDPLSPPPDSQQSHGSTTPRRPAARPPARLWRPRSPPPAPRSLYYFTDSVAMHRRKYVYRHRLFASHVGVNRFSRYRDVTPEIFTRDPNLQSRARKWIRRELGVFDFLSPDYEAQPGAEHGTRAARSMRRAQNAEFVLQYIVSLLHTIDLRCATGRAQDLVGELLGYDKAVHFLHELGAWLRSPYQDLRDWDRHVQYARPLPDFTTLEQRPDQYRPTYRTGPSRVV